MTNKQIEQYNIRYLLDNNRCQRCGEKATQIAHRIGQGKINRKKYGNDIIDHNMNLVSSCQECNDYFNIGMNPAKCNLLINVIREKGDQKIISENITIRIS